MDMLSHTINLDAGLSIAEVAIALASKTLVLAAYLSASLREHREQSWKSVQPAADHGATAVDRVTQSLSVGHQGLRSCRPNLLLHSITCQRSPAPLQLWHA